MMLLKGKLIMEFILLNLLEYTESGYINPIESFSFTSRLFLIANFTYQVLIRLSRSLVILSILLSDLIIIVSLTAAAFTLRTVNKKVTSIAFNLIIN